jgi:serine/threonine-protein kinase PknK
VLKLGVKIVGALETAHRLQILHRDVKPANILLTDYGEPALTDFGIAHIAGGFKTATGTFTGSPAFTAPEILSGDPPSVASDVYGLGATLFCALTGHAAYERRSGEQVVTQFLRIATEPVPDLRDSGIPDDVSAAIEKAMFRDPACRPSAVELGEELQRVQARHEFPVDELALRAEPQAVEPARQPTTTAGIRRTLGNIPLELTSFVGRRTELSDLKDLLSQSRLVTLTGIGGVGKTRLALRAAAEARHDYTDGVWLAELGELRDGSLLVDVVAASLGLREQPGAPLSQALVEYLSLRKLLLVLDNCEQVIDAAAKLAETLLRACPDLRILATSREALGIGAETVLRLAPLTLPPDPEPTLRGLPNYDAVALFAERAAAAVPGFKLTDDNKATVARICAKLDGLPLAIELAAARLKAMSPEQILERLGDRYSLLTRGSRGAPTRQQTLSWSVGWSYELCTPAEQRLWGRLSVFAGSFELEAAEYICGADMDSEDFVDLLTSLVDKSVLLRTESNGLVRFRLIETLRDYGRERIRPTGDYPELRRRHRDWYERLAAEAEAAWFGSEQVQWIQRLERELPNLREALEFGPSEDGHQRPSIAAAMGLFWISRGLFGEARRWLDRELDSTAPVASVDRAKTLYYASLLAGLQGDVSAARARVAQGHALVRATADPTAHALVSLAEGFSALFAGDFHAASTCVAAALAVAGDPVMEAPTLLLLGWAYEFAGDTEKALVWQQKALALSESHGELAFRTYALWSIAIAKLHQGERDRAAQLMRQGLSLAHRLNDARTAGSFLEALAWTAAEEHDPQRAVVLMGAADALGRQVGSPTIPFSNLLVQHEQCERSARQALGAETFEAALRHGSSLSFDEAVAYALSD